MTRLSSHKLVTRRCVVLCGHTGRLQSVTWNLRGRGSRRSARQEISRSLHRLHRSLVSFLLALSLFLPPAPSALVTDVAAVDVNPLPSVREADDRWGINHVDSSARSQQLALDTGAKWNRWEFRW